MWTTADLCDQYLGNEKGATLQVAQPLLRSFGGISAFCGAIATVQVQDDNTSVRLRLQEAGNGRVLVVEGGGSLTCALLGDQLALLAVNNGWAGVVVHGCIRDSAAIGQMKLGVLALATLPAKSEKRGPGLHDVTVHFAAVDFTPSHYLYADADGILVSATPLA